MKRALFLCGLILIVLAGSIFAAPYNHYSINSNRNNTGTEHNYSGNRMSLGAGRSPENMSLYRPPAPPDYDSPQIPYGGNNVVPEPGTILSLGLGSLGLALRRKLTK